MGRAEPVLGQTHPGKGWRGVERPLVRSPTASVPLSPGEVTPRQRPGGLVVRSAGTSSVGTSQDKCDSEATCLSLGSDGTHSPGWQRDPSPGVQGDPQWETGRVKHRTLILPPCLHWQSCRYIDRLTHLIRLRSVQIDGVRSGREQLSGYRYPPPPPLAGDGTRWEAPAASPAPTQAYPEPS